VLENLGLANSLAKRYHWHPEFSDIRAACYLGLCEAALHWDPKRGKFSTYSRYCMLGEVSTILNGTNVVPIIIESTLRSRNWNDFVSELICSELKPLLLSLIEELPEEQQHVILLKFPLDANSKTYSDVQIGIMLQISSTWVGQLRERAFSYLRNKLERLNLG